MAKKKKNKRPIFNYRKVIQQSQNAPVRTVYPGMVMDFFYKSPKTYDPKPIVLVIWNDYQNYLCHGINLNYLRRDQITDLIEKLVKGAEVYGDWGSHRKFDTIFKGGKEIKIVDGDEKNKLIQETQRKTINPKLRNVNEATSVKDDNQEKDYNNNLPYKNVLKKPYTRLKLPTYRENRGGNPLSQAQARRQMKMLYEKVIEKFLNRGDQFQVYRTYKYEHIREPRVLTIDWEKLA